jgi:hypothetical protein
MSSPLMIVNLVNTNESPQAIDQQTRALVSDFRMLEGVTATIPAEAAPPGSRGDPVTIGTIVLAFVAGGGITAIIQALSDWTKRGENRKVVLKITVDGNTFETEFPSQGITQKQLIELTEKIKKLITGKPKPESCTHGNLPRPHYSL